jgi:ABC-2 type transport system ATP-binding protein
MNSAVSQPLIKINQLTKRFGDFTALNRCELEIRQGEVFGLLGPNGAGKSTLLRLLLGFMKPTSGSATINELDCYNERVQAHRELAYLPGDARLPKTMRGRQILNFFAGLGSSSGNKTPARTYERSLEIANRLELDLSRWVAFMSTGMRQKLALAIVLASNSPLVILDEPTANLDPTVRGEVIQLVSEAKSAGRTVVFSSHVLSEIEDVCDRAGILRAGELVHLQNMDELMRQHRIRAKVEGPLPEVPELLKDQFEIQKTGENEILIETPGELSVVLKWLAASPVSDVFIQPVGLRAIYDRYHGGNLNSVVRESA